MNIKKTQSEIQDALSSINDRSRSVWRRAAGYLLWAALLVGVLGCCYFFGRFF